MTDFFILENCIPSIGGVQDLKNGSSRQNLTLNFSNNEDNAQNALLYCKNANQYNKTFFEFKEICARLFNSNLLYIRLNNGIILQYKGIMENLAPNTGQIYADGIMSVMIITDGGLPLYGECQAGSLPRDMDPNDTTVAGLINVMLKICWEILGSEVSYFEMEDKRVTVLHSGGYYYLCIGQGGGSATAWLADFAQRFAAKHGHHMAYYIIIPNGEWLSKHKGDSEYFSKGAAIHG